MTDGPDQLVESVVVLHKNKDSIDWLISQDCPQKNSMLKLIVDGCGAWRIIEDELRSEQELAGHLCDVPRQTGVA